MQQVPAQWKAAVGSRVPLLPEQRRFLGEDLGHHHFNVAVLSQVHPPVDASICEAALQAVVAWHPGLRVGLHSDGDRELGQAGSAEVHVERVDLSACPDDKLGDSIEPVARRLQTSFALAEPPLVRAVHFATGEGRLDRFLVVIHHFVIDGLSAQVFVRDFIAACDSLLLGERPAQMTRSIDATTWARQLTELAGSGQLDHEVDTWLRTAERVDPLPVDHGTGANTRASLDVAIATLTGRQTERLFAALARVNTTMPNLLVAALLEVAHEAYGVDRLGVSLVGDGRRGLLPKTNLASTIGWIATKHPVTVRRVGGGDIVTAVGEQLLRSPRRGASYNVLRYLSPHADVVERLARLGEPEIIVNYQGRLNPARLFRATRPGGARPVRLEPASEPIGPNVTDEGLRSEHHHLSAVVLGDELVLQWHFSTNLHRQETTRGLLDGLVATVDRWAHAVSP